MRGLMQKTHLGIRRLHMTGAILGSLALRQFFEPVWTGAVHAIGLGPLDIKQRRRERLYVQY